MRNLTILLLAVAPCAILMAQTDTPPGGSLLDIAPPPQAEGESGPDLMPGPDVPAEPPPPRPAEIGDLASPAPVPQPTEADAEALRRAMEEVAPLVRERKWAEAAAAMERHVAQARAEPLRHQLLYHAGTFHFQARNLEASEARFKEALAIIPAAPLAMVNLSAVEIARGRSRDAVVRLEALQPQYIVDRNIAFIAFFNLACAHAQLGDAEAAVRNLAQAIQRDTLRGLANIGDRHLDPIREDPRFQDLVWMAEQAVTPPPGRRP